MADNVGLMSQIPQLMIPNRAKPLHIWFLSKVQTITCDPTRASCPPQSFIQSSSRILPLVCQLHFFKHRDHGRLLTLSDAEVKSEADLLPPGAAPGTMPTDLEQSTGLERFEILGKMQGIDVFDMKPLDASRKGTCVTLKAFRRNQESGRHLSKDADS